MFSDEEIHDDYDSQVNVNSFVAKCKYAANSHLVKTSYPITDAQKGVFTVRDWQERRRTTVKRMPFAIPRPSKPVAKIDWLRICYWPVKRGLMVDAVALSMKRLGW